MDPRFRGWGWEDNAFNLLLDSTIGKAYLGRSKVYHFWHGRKRDDKGRPAWEGQTERNAELGRRYKRLAYNHESFDSLIKEVKNLTNI
jgi:hypothetical protein